MLCDNCETERAVYRCRHCEDRFCEPCSFIHPQVKATKAHKLYLIVDSIEENSCGEAFDSKDLTASIDTEVVKNLGVEVEVVDERVDVFYRVGSWICENLPTFTPRADARTVFGALGVSLFIHLFSKVFLGKLSTATYIVSGIALYKFLSSMQKRYKVGIEKIAKV